MSAYSQTDWTLPPVEELYLCLNAVFPKTKGNESPAKNVSSVYSFFNSTGPKCLWVQEFRIGWVRGKAGLKLDIRNYFAGKLKFEVLQTSEYCGNASIVHGLLLFGCTLRVLAFLIDVKL